MSCREKQIFLILKSELLQHLTFDHIFVIFEKCCECVKISDLGFDNEDL